MGLGSQPARCACSPRAAPPAPAARAATDHRGIRVGKPHHTALSDIAACCFRPRDSNLWPPYSLDAFSIPTSHRAAKSLIRIHPQPCACSDAAVPTSHLLPATGFMPSRASAVSSAAATTRPRCARAADARARGLSSRLRRPASDDKRKLCTTLILLKINLYHPSNMRMHVPRWRRPPCRPDAARLA